MVKNYYMKKYIKHSFITAAIILILILASCSAAPPIEPNDGFQPYSAPSAPSGVTATNGYADTITVKWNEVEGATSYQIWGIEAKKYGSSSQKASTVTSYSSLIERGFQLLDVVEGTSYKLSNTSANVSYVFSIVTMKGSRGSGNVLYSAPSSFVQGGTIGEILFSAVANSEQVALFWDISNAYSVLDNSEKKKALYSYKIYISYKLSSAEEWKETLELGEEDLENHTHSYPATTLDIDTKYDFKMKLEVLDAGGKAINTIESATYTVLTDSTLVPERVIDLTAESGKEKGKVTLTWTTPSLPERTDITPVFTIQRSIDGETWTTVEENHKGTKAGEAVSYTDETVQDNTVYSYRVLNGYQLEGMNAIYQMENNAAVIKNVYSFWLPTDVNFNITGDVNSKTITVSYTYNPPQEQTEEETKKDETEDGKENPKTDDEKTAKLTRDTSDQPAADQTSGTETDKSKEIKVYIGGEYRLESNLETKADLSEQEGASLKISVEADSPLRYYSIYASFKVGGTEILKVDYPNEITLGKSSATKDLISDFKASKNLVKAVVLSWKVKENETINSYEIYEDGEKKSGYIEPAKTGSCSVTLDRDDDGKNHDYKIKATTTSSRYDIESAQGNSLAKPSGLTASDSTSVDGITITWPVDDDTNVVYELYYSDNKEGNNWEKLTETKAGEAFLGAKKDGTDGKPYYFKLKAYNKTQSNQPTLESDVETGSVFGSALMNATVKDNGKDPDKITISWKEVTGASYYRIKRNGGDYLPGKTTGTTYSDYATSIKNLDGNTPLNETYTYTVVPFMADGTAALKGSETKGKLFAPPLNVKASKGEKVDGITVTWNTVEYATSYEIEKYESKLINGAVTTGGVSIGNVTVTGTSYSESTNKIISYRIRAVRTEETEDGTVEIKSAWQDGTETVKNAQGFDESSHVGYGLAAVSTLNVASAVTSDGYYAPYVAVTWEMVPGATSYTITNGLGGSVTVNTNALSYDKEKTTTNGTSSTASGYLSYNPSTQQYTYNDASGRMTNTYAISNYSIKASNGSASSASKSTGDTVYRQPTAEDWINIVNSILQPAFTDADNHWGGDWWLQLKVGETKETYTYNSSFVFHLCTNAAFDGSTTYHQDKNYLEIKEYKDPLTGLTLKTTSNICFDVNDEGAVAYTGTDPLKLIGYNGNGTISVTTSQVNGYNFRDFSIKYNDVNVRSDEGSFYVTISGSSGREIKNSEFVKIL